MQVRVLCFGVLKEWLGAAEVLLELPEGATVAGLLRSLCSRGPAPALQGIAVSVNSEYATAAWVLHHGDEVGLLPPVSGGSQSHASLSLVKAPGLDSFVSLTFQPIDSQPVIEAARRGEDGAVLSFDGTVRDNTRGRQTLYLDYEAYQEMAEKQLRELAADARARFGVRHVTIIHRLGRVLVGETSVLIVVASAHRAAAFDACRWLIDTLKKTVPIWKKETFADGAVWAAGEPFPARLAVDSEGDHEA